MHQDPAPRRGVRLPNGAWLDLDEYAEFLKERDRLRNAELGMAPLLVLWQLAHREHPGEQSDAVKTLLLKTAFTTLDPGGRDIMKQSARNFIMSFPNFKAFCNAPVPQPASVWQQICAILFRR